MRKPIQCELLTKEKKGKLVFDGQLPKLDCEYYQFVYVSNGKVIRGASIPFQYRRCEVPEMKYQVPSMIPMKEEMALLRKNFEVS